MDCILGFIVTKKEKNLSRHKNIIRRSMRDDEKRESKKDFFLKLRKNETSKHGYKSMKDDLLIFFNQNDEKIITIVLF